jgi:hypothetical protein
MKAAVIAMLLPLLPSPDLAEYINTPTTASATSNAAPSGVTSNAAPSTITIDGTTYQDVRWGRLTPSTVTIFHRTGIATMPLWKLPPDLQKQFGYDPQKAADWQKVERQHQEAALAERERLAEEKRRTELLQQRIVGIGGTVTDVIEGQGVILSNEIFVNAAPGVIPPSSCFLVCDTKNLVNGSTFECAAYLDGTYTYITVTGGSRKIHRWVYYGPRDKAKEGTVSVY